MALKKIFKLNIEMTKHLFRASPKYFIINLLNTIINQACYMFQTLFLRHIINIIVGNEVLLGKVTVYYTFYYSVIILCNMFIFKIDELYNHEEKVKICNYYKNLIYSASVKPDLKTFDGYDYQDKLYQAVFNDGDYLISFSENLFRLISSVISLVFVSYIFWQINFIFIVLAAITAIKNILVNHFINDIGFKKSQDILHVSRKEYYIENVFYLIKYIKEIKLFNTDNLFISKYGEVKDEYINTIKKPNNKIYKVRTFETIIDTLVYLMNIILLVMLLLNNGLTVGDFYLVLANTAALSGNLTGIINFFPNIINDSKYMFKIFEIMDYNNEIKQEDFNYTRDNIISFKNVSFSYNDEAAIKDMTVTLPLNRKIALLGENGSGKTTFLKLLMGLYKPEKGEIIYSDKIDMENKPFNVLFQEYHVFALDIAENILPEYKKNDIDKIIDSLKFSEIYDDITELENGIHTTVTREFLDDGVNFSGGQKQKIAISRAYANSNPILIFDEPTSNLDPVSSNKIIDKINRLSKDKSVLYVTHTLAHAKNADLICFFSNGRITETGTHSELMEKKGDYFLMFNKQSEKFTDCLV